MGDFSKLKIKLHLSIGIGAKITDEHFLSDYFDEDVWNALSEEEQQKELDEISDEWASNYIECRVTLSGGGHV